jgi:hypothetical protein
MRLVAGDLAKPFSILELFRKRSVLFNRCQLSSPNWTKWPPYVTLRGISRNSNQGGLDEYPHRLGKQGP